MRFPGLASLAVFALLMAATPAFAHEVGEAHHHGVEILPLLMRWAHILSAVILVGGAFFMRFVLAPVANATLDPTIHETLRDNIRARWKKFVFVFIALFLVSGFYNYLMVTRFEHDGEPVYHMLFGIKFLLALVVFALASFLTGRTSIAKKMQANNGFWMGMLVLLAILTVAIGGYMKLM